MPQYLAPGVYVEEVASSSAPIAGVGTSTAGFIGQVDNGVQMPPQPGQFQLDAQNKPQLDANGKPIPILYIVTPTNKPTLITNWLQFKNAFGDIQAGNQILSQAVYGFFNNGGTRCWVTRVADVGVAKQVSDALDGFAAIDEIALVAVPGALSVAIQGAILDHCENTGDRFAILDGHRTITLTPAAIKGADAGATPPVNPVRNSTYGALYFPWISVLDPIANADVFQPPSGHIAGIYSRVDTLRGVHKAPANEVIRGSTGVELLVSKSDQDGLNPDGINVIRNFDGNITVWGARTLADPGTNAEWKYVPVRRLFLFLRESIDQGTRWAVFEPNDPALWAKINRNVTAFLTNVWRSGALFGATPQEAFYVKCDAETNPPEVRDLGQVVTEIGVAVVKPAEFVIFRISQWAGPGQ